MTYAANAYARTANVVLTPREAEAALLIKAAAKMQAFRSETISVSTALTDALMFNQRVWTVLATAIADPSNPLPAEIRRNVGNIAVYVLRTVVDAMLVPTAEKLDSLIMMNHQIAAGLQGSAGNPAA